MGFGKWASAQAWFKSKFSKVCEWELVRVVDRT